MASGNPKSRGNVGRDLFGIQLEITEKLLEAEEKKLRVLKAEIEAGKRTDAAKDTSKARELEIQEANFLRIKMQQQRLAQEIQDAAVAGIIQKRPKMKASRSLPAMVLKATPKNRPSVFDHLVPQAMETSPPPQSIFSPSSSISSTLLTPGLLSDELVYQDGVLIAGSLDALIDLLIPTPSRHPDHSYVFAFILCSRLFMQPYELLARVSRIFHFRTKKMTQGVEEVASRMVQLLQEWTETFPYDFRDERMMRSLKDLTQTCSTFPELRKSVGQVQALLVKKLSILDKYEHILAQVNAVAMERLIDPKTQVNIQLVCDSPATLAQQLTHIELERLNNIGPEEFIQTFVKYPNQSEHLLYRDMKKTSNIEAYVEWFNRLSYLVATEICVADKTRNRAKLIEFFADTASECRKLNNFNSYIAISAGLFMSSVTRLKRTRAKVNSSKIHSIEEFADPISNFSTYRNTLERAISRANAAKEGSQSWVVPFFSLLVKDIYFLHQGMSDRDDRGFVRFAKCMSHARLVSQILGYKDRVLPFPRIRNVLNYLMTIPIHTDDELQLASYEIEPPEHPGEKKRYQDLRTLLGSFGARISRLPSTSSTSSSPPLSPDFPPIQEEA